MLHVILLVLKIIGLVLLGILGLILALILVVLFVPIRYRVEGSFLDGKPLGILKVTWLLHILSMRVTFEEELDFSLRLFGVRLFRGKEEPEEEDPLLKQDADRREAPEEDADGDFDELVQIQEIRPGDGNPSDESGEYCGKKSASGRGIKCRIRHMVEKIRLIFRQICDKLKQINKHYNEILEFIRDEENQRTCKLIFRQVKRLLRHVLPGKAAGTVIFGFEDPYTTGQILSAVSLLYAWYGKQIEIVPVFDEAVLEGTLKLKGRIRIGIVLWYGLRVYLNKNFRVLLKRFRGR